MNAEYSHQGGLRLPLNGLALGELSKQELKCWQLLGRQPKGPREHVGQASDTPRMTWEQVAEEALAVPGSVQAATPGQGPGGPCPLSPFVA